MRPISPVLLALLVGCASFLDPESSERVRELGAIAGYNYDDPRIEIVTGSGSATVTVTTYGGGCHSKGETEVQVQEREVRITPYNYTAPPGSACTLPLISFYHEATIAFGASGPARIIVRGLDQSRATAANPIGDTITVERTVEIP